MRGLGMNVSVPLVPRPPRQSSVGKYSSYWTARTRGRVLLHRDRLVRVHGGHRPVNERAGGVAVAESGFAELSVVEDQRILAVTTAAVFRTPVASIASALTAPGGRSPPTASAHH